ncbi:MAG: CDP-alcohol phosphatidyltransferase family protein [Candidatus Atribacteria bacterium]|nr:MAG: CDP-alcohol phosphatidyltransferase family protein [Candidatus Atribacteria bacterium]
MVRVVEMRKLPDLLTLSRGLVAIAVLLLGFVGPQALEAVILLMIVGWTTDIFDGRLARKYHKPPTWIGEREFIFDMMMVFSGLAYLVMAGFIDRVLALGYIVIAAICIAFFRSKMITMSFATPLVALPLVIASLNAPRAALIYLIWIAGALALDWSRFKGVIREFLDNAKKLPHR